MPDLHPSEAARRAFGIRLRDLRLDAGLNGRELSELAGLRNTKISRIEHGRQNPTEDDIRSWATACGAEGQIPELIADHRQVEQMWSEHRRTLRAGQKQVQSRGLSVYQAANLVRIYEAFDIPAILQTYEYARAQRLATAHLHKLPTDDIEDATRNRLASQFLITEGGGPMFSFVLESSALYNRLDCDVDTMREQYAFLIESAARPNVALGIIPLGVRRPFYPGEGFQLFDERQVRQDFWSGGLRASRPEDIAYFNRLFGMLRELAVYGGRARAEINRANAFLQTRENL